MSPATRLTFISRVRLYSFGYQLGVSFKITDIISVAAGARYVTAKNTYEGHVKDIMITAAPLNPALGGTMTPGNYLRSIGTTFGMDFSSPGRSIGYADH